MKQRDPIVTPFAIAQTGEAKAKPSLWQRVVPQWFRALPRGLPENEHKIYSLRLLVPVIGATVHASLAVLYTFIDVPAMAVVNLVSVAVFGVAIALVRSGRHYLGTWVAIAEVFVHVPVSTLLLGLEIGYLFFNFIVAICATMTFPHEKHSRSVISLYSFLSSVALIILMQYYPPVWRLDPWKNALLFYLCASSTFLALLAFGYYFSVVTNAAEKRIEVELARSEQLLLNVLPAAIATRLKSSRDTIADNFDSATVLFADICGFTTMCATRDSQQIVDMLNQVFSLFDRIAARYGLEKIKTIGDAYMVVGGVPEARADHAETIVRMALEMRAVVKKLSATFENGLEIRIGIHTGPVIAGVIGERKFAYDLWGDTVNTASRMESHGIPGSIQVSSSTHALIRGKYDLEARGAIDVKGKGKIETWFVRGYLVEPAKDESDAA